MSRKLSLNDIVDLRAYEREREQFREQIIAIKARRRVSVGPIVSIVFESRDTIRFQIQEMARAERMLSDEQIQGELKVYNPLIPDPGELSATMFIELTSKADLMEWLPKLVGIERAVELRLGESSQAEVVRAEPEEEHAAQLTREEVTASVHYIRFRLSPDQVDRFARGSVVLAVNHQHYQEATPLSQESVEELLKDLRE